MNCDPASLLSASQCFKCIPRGDQGEVILYLLNQILGTNLTPQQLMDQAKCFKCIPSGMQEEVQTYLLCQLAGGVVGTPLIETVPTGNEQLFGVFTFVDSGVVTSLEWRGTTTDAGFDIDCNGTLSDIKFPNLVSIDPAGLQNGLLNLAGTALATVSAPLLASVNGSIKVRFSSLTSLAFPVLVSVGGEINFTQNPGLVSLNVPLLVPSDGTLITLSDCALSAASVEQILRRCVLAGVTTCTIDVSGGTNAGTASLNAQGQADVATLGAQLTINP